MEDSLLHAIKCGVQLPIDRLTYDFQLQGGAFCVLALASVFLLYCTLGMSQERMWELLFGALHLRDLLRMGTAVSTCCISEKREEPSATQLQPDHCVRVIP